MKKNKRTTKLLVLPVLVVPFLTMGFWVLGGGKDSSLQHESATKGLNLHLPEANFKDDETMDKLAFYDKADKDSLKLQEYMRSDPYYNKETDGVAPVGNELQQLTQTTASKFTQHLNTSPYETSRESPEKQLMDKLALLEKELSKPVDVKEQTQVDKVMGDHPKFAGEVDRLESMLQRMNNGSGEDPEMKQLDGTLDKILDIQHPERVKERTRDHSPEHKKMVYTVSTKLKEASVSLLDTLKKIRDTQPGFYGLNDQALPSEENEAIAAVVHENQLLVNGAVIKLRLTHGVFINGTLIPKGNFVYGIVSLNEERLNVSINSIRNNHSLFPVKLEVYDMDGLPGIYIPGAITRDVAKQSADHSLQLMEPSSMDPSFKAQATTAGISTAKNLLSKKVKLVKVMVKAGYKVLLKVQQ